MHKILSGGPCEELPLHEARSEFSKLFDRALAGEPQRVTRHGQEAVVIVSEAAWNARPKSAPTLADLFLKTVGSDEQATRTSSAIVPEPIALGQSDRPLGAYFAD